MSPKCGIGLINYSPFIQQNFREASKITFEKSDYIKLKTYVIKLHAIMSQFLYLHTDKHTQRKNIRRVSVKTLTVNFSGWQNYKQFFFFSLCFTSFSKISTITIHYFCHQKSKWKMFRNLELQSTIKRYVAKYNPQSAEMETSDRKN